MTTEGGYYLGEIPEEGVSIAVNGGLGLISDIAGSAELNLTDMNSSITPESPLTKCTMSGDMNASCAIHVGIGYEASGTFNVSFQRGALGDWLFDNFVQPFYDIQYYRELEQYYSWKTESGHRQLSWNAFLNDIRQNTGGLPQSMLK